MIDLFKIPKIYPRPTRTVNLTGEAEPGAVRPYQPRANTQPDPDIDPALARERAKKALWHREKLRKDEKFRKEKNRRQRERYAKMPPEKKAALLERMKLDKREKRGSYRGD